MKSLFNFFQNLFRKKENSNRKVLKEDIQTKSDFNERYEYDTDHHDIGSGGFATVYKAYDHKLSREVAIKISQVKIIDGKKFSLKDEFDAIGDLPVHTNIANYEHIYTFKSSEGTFDYAIIQYYPDGNLHNYLRKRASIQDKENIAIQLLKGLQFLHQHKVVHRDFKPSNVLLSIRNLENRKQISVKITDFGLSKKVNNEGAFSNSITAGTIAYCSPEQFLAKIDPTTGKHKKLLFNTDLWAYGVVLYEVFTGKRLFEVNKEISDASQDIELKKLILEEDIDAKLAILPEKWRQIATRCLVRNPDGRAQSTEELLELLHKQDVVIEKDGGRETEVFSDIDEIENQVIKDNGQTLPESEAGMSSRKKLNVLYFALPAIACFFLAYGGYAWYVSYKKAEVVTETSVVETPSAADEGAKQSEATAKDSVVETIPQWKTVYETQNKIINKAIRNNDYSSVVPLCEDLLKKLPIEATYERSITEKTLKRAKKSNLDNEVAANKKYWDKIFAPIGDNMIVVQKNGLSGTADIRDYKMKIKCKYSFIQQPDNGGEIKCTYTDESTDIYYANGKFKQHLN